jgi:hypothetical protein
MKKIILTIIGIFTISALFAQVEKSDYEKYWEAKEAARFGDTLVLSTEEAKAQFPEEYDDLYYTSKDKKQVTTIFNKKSKQPVSIETQSYNKGYNDGIEDMYGDFYYTSRIYRFHYGIGFSYYNPYWSISWGNPYWYDPFYYDWYYPYYSWRYPNYNYNYWYSPWYYDSYYSWRYPNYNYYYSYNYYNYRSPNYGHGALGSKYYGYDSRYGNTKNSYIPVGNSKSISQQKYVTNGMRKSSSTALSQPQKSVNTVTQERRVNPQDKPLYNESKRTYTPTYSTPRMSQRPQYNNTRTTTRTSTSTQTRTYNGTQGNVQRRTTNATQSRSYVTPQTRSVSRTPQSYTRPTTQPSRSYSAPSRTPSTAPSRSYNTPTQSRSVGTSTGRSSGSSMSKSSSGSSSSRSSSGRR